MPPKVQTPSKTKKEDDEKEHKKDKKDKKDKKRKNESSDSETDTEVNWLWAADKDSDKNWNKFDKDLSSKLEVAFKKKDSQVKIDKERFVDLSDPDQMFQRRYSNMNKKRAVKREVIDARKKRKTSKDSSPTRKSSTPPKSLKALKACRDGEKCDDKTQTHLDKYTHPCPYGETCFRQNNPIHAATMSHPCPNGPKCLLAKRGEEEHCAKFSHPSMRQPCKYGEKCTKRDEALYADHNKKNSHPCPYGEKCNYLKQTSAKAADHKRLLLHPCPNGPTCSQQGDNTHLMLYTHVISLLTGGLGSSKIIPDYWDNWDQTKQNLLEVELVGNNKHKNEMDRVLKSFTDSGVKIRNVVSLKRVQNFRLWLQYWSARERVSSRALNAGKRDIERTWLFHGCRQKEVLDNILNNGFDQQRANSQPFGVWFAEKATYSWGGYTINHNDGSKEIILARVMVGTPGDDDGSGRRALVKGNSVELADCQTHRQGAINIFVVYRPDQCYPEYVLRAV
eukprot:TRINITY_DN8133_c0_g1_i1.p1 TRINITY_DN8133_c0_g1~~TRINITY_DN8133_c0_g1_i1.p1  ORF type:complete len:506 (-),score=103.25 TRINITY_DN8133_c0_g1_i1:81-1598(-)